MPKESASGTYGEQLVPGQPAVLAHVDALATMARLFGMQPQTMDRCRVLELGTGLGGNLFPMAVRYPQSTFVGVNDSPDLTAAARDTAQALELANVEFLERRLEDLDERLGTFDYVICHGVFSWLPRDAQRRLLADCRDRLNPQGVAYVSYKTLPGAAWPLVVRELVGAGSAPTAAAAERIGMGRNLLRFALRALQSDGSAYAQLLAGEIDPALRSSDAWFAHEQLGGEHHPHYFHQFVARAAQCELQYLGDAEIGTMFSAGLGPGFESSLQQISGDQVSLEQHMDFLRNRAIHRSLLCHAAVKIDHRLTGENLRGLLLAANLQREGAPVDVSSDAEARFLSPAGTVVASTLPPLKAALAELTAAWPRSVPFEELLDRVAGRLPHGAGRGAAISDADRRLVGDFLVACLLTGFVEAHSDVDRFVATLSARPCACPWARAQAEVTSAVTNRRHARVALDAMSQNILRLLDGRRDRADLLAVVREAADKGQLSILLSGMPASQSELSGDVLAQALDLSLEQLAASALLVA